MNDAASMEIMAPEGMPREVIMSVLTGRTLCGHDDSTSKFATVDGKIVMCQECYHIVEYARNDYMTGKLRLGVVRARLTPVVGSREARGYCRQLLRARLSNLLTFRRFPDGDS